MLLLPDICLALNFTQLFYLYFLPEDAVNPTETFLHVSFVFCLNGPTVTQAKNHFLLLLFVIMLTISVYTRYMNNLSCSTLM